MHLQLQTRSYILCELKKTRQTWKMNIECLGSYQPMLIYTFEKAIGKRWQILVASVTLCYNPVKKIHAMCENT